MKNYLGICLVSCFALFGLGSAIRCYSCSDMSQTCTGVTDCSGDDACLTLFERGGKTYRQCLKYSQCDASILANLPGFSPMHQFSFNCCNKDLCNGATSSTTSKPLLGLFASLAVMWWCMH